MPQAFYNSHVINVRKDETNSSENRIFLNL